jgi:ATP-dependent helicase/nuclease subunit B
MYRSFDSEMKRLFGRKVWKLSLDGGMTCPNRDGTLGVGGCVFCAGGGRFVPEAALSVDAQIEKASRAVAEEYLSGVLTQRDLTSARMRHLCERIEKLALLVAKNIFEEFSSSRFTPALFEQRIGYGEGDIPPLEITLADSTKLAIRGIVDRVDVYRADGRVYVRVVDYKTGKKTFSLDDLSLGLNTQMLFYLFALCSPTAKDPLFGGDTPCPAGIMYLSSDVAVQNLEQYTDSATVLANAEDALKRNGLLLNDEEVLRAMNESLCAKFLAGIKMKKNGELSGKALTTLDEFEDIKRQITEVVSGVAERMKSGVADIAPISHGNSPCEHCSMKPVCRRIERKTDTESTENSEHEEE